MNLFKEALKLFAAFVAMFLFMAFLAVATTPRHPYAARKASCSNNLKQIGLSFAMYRNEMRSYPDLSPEVGELIPVSEMLQPEYMPDLSVYGCPAPDQPEQWRWPWSPEPPLPPKPTEISDHDYFYLGYAITSPEQGLEFIRAYAQAALAGESLDMLNVPGLFTLSNVYAQREIGALDYATESQIPVLIEKPGNHQPQEMFNVLFFDGHVATMKRDNNKGVFTPGVIDGLKMLAELDELPPDQRQQHLEMLADYGL